MGYSVLSDARARMPFGKPWAGVLLVLAVGVSAAPSGCGQSAAVAVAAGTTGSGGANDGGGACMMPTMPPGIVWTKQATSGLPYGMAIDAANELVVTGSMDGSIDCSTMTGSGTGNTTVFVEKLDPAGACQWAEAFEADWSGTIATLSVTTDSAGNIAMAGGCNGAVCFGAPGPGGADTFVVKLSPEGATQWVRLFEGHPLSAADAVAVDGAGDVLVTGSYYDSVDFGCGPVGGGVPVDPGAYVAALSPDGVTLWARTFSDDTQEEGDEIGGAGVVADTAGNVYVTGAFDGSIDYGNGPILSSLFSVFLVKLNP